MTDEISRPILLTHFPFEIKPFYMQRAEDDQHATESCNFLAPGVGEIVGGGMRIWDFEELMAAYKLKGIDRPEPVFLAPGPAQVRIISSWGYGLGPERHAMHHPFPSL